MSTYVLPDKNKKIEELDNQLNRRKTNSTNSLNNRKQELLNGLTNKENTVKTNYQNDIKNHNQQVFSGRQDLMQMLSNRGIKGGLEVSEHMSQKNRMNELLSGINQNKTNAMTGIASERNLVNSQYQNDLDTLNQDLEMQRMSELAKIDELIRSESNNKMRFDYEKYLNELQQQNWETQFDYGKSQDKLNQSNWERQFALSKSSSSGGLGGDLGDNLDPDSAYSELSGKFKDLINGVEFKSIVPKNQKVYLDEIAKQVRNDKNIPQSTRTVLLQDIKAEQAKVHKKYQSNMQRIMSRGSRSNTHMVR